MKYDILLLTESRYENPLKPDWYQQQILTEDGLVIAALEKHGLRARRIDWATPNFDWRNARLLVFRTTWDYFERFEAFLPWLDATALQVPMLNPYALLRWSLDKRYLLDLAQRGVRIVPTKLVERGAHLPLQHCFAEFDCPELIIKPCVGGTARHTYRVRPDNLSEMQALFQQLLAEEAMLVQPFQHSVPLRGEVSVIVIGGQVSHAVRKIAKPGDFRVQDDFGGTVQAHQPSAAEQALAEQAVAACQPRPAYARVDIMEDNTGQPAISELELVEPELFFRFHPPAAAALAREIVRALSYA
jgi:glutathione synthase/RimK-type ligase-like ATP-grasp enzyme